ncbi:MAG: glycosyltransferase [Chlamydiia bacterium]|nr:glycosyltransferase [Chlamydiia bacterium]
MIEKYRAVVGDEVVEHLRLLGHHLNGASVVHVNSTRMGGGVAEILQKMVPLMESLGIQVHWEVLTADPEFYQCTKLFHNSLQGDRVVIPNRLLDQYEQTNQINAEQYRERLNNADFVLIHDPQPAAMIQYFPERKGKWFWRCHIDASHPNRMVWNYLQKFVTSYDGCIFSLVDFTQRLNQPKYIVRPSIDPLSEKNQSLSEEDVRGVCLEFGIDSQRPMLLQVSRFDRFKDPLGVIQAYQMAKRFRSDLQLVLAGGGAEDDPEGEIVLEEVRKIALDDPDIHVLLLPPDANLKINALQRAADIILQKSLKEGFGLTVTEALWKGKPVIGGNVGGIRLQVVNHHTGFLVNTPEGAAHRIRYLLQYSDERERMGSEGKQFVKENFLITRHLQELLSIFLIHKTGQVGTRIMLS